MAQRASSRSREQPSGSGAVHSERRASTNVRQAMERQTSGQYVGPVYGVPPAAFESSPVPSYTDPGLAGIGFPVGAIAGQQLPFQHGFITPATRNMSPSSVYGVYPTPPTSYDGSYRGTPAAVALGQQSPSMVMQSTAYAPPEFSPAQNGGTMGAYNYSPSPFYGQQQTGQPNLGRRGRVCVSDFNLPFNQTNRIQR